MTSLSSVDDGNERQRRSLVEEGLLEGVDKTTFDSPGRGLLRTVEVLFQPSAVVELRAFRGRETVSGYYADHVALAREARKLDERDYTVYVTLNEVDPALLARASNRKRKVYRELTTSDGDIVHRRWLPLDLDPARPSGVSATDAEKRAAKERALQLWDFLSEAGRSRSWPTRATGTTCSTRWICPTTRRAWSWSRASCSPSPSGSTTIG